MHVVALAGHVDHGKSALVHALTGMPTDRYRSEQERGLTQDLGFAWLAGPPEVALVDVPGHADYLATTLAGLGPSPSALLVVAADAGWREQTEEHVSALAGLRVPGTRVVAAITRTDLPSVDPGRLDAVTREVRERLTTRVGGPAAVLPVSARTGAGLPALRTALTGLPGSPREAAETPVRVWLDRSFTVSGSGTVVTGTLVSGRLTQTPGERLHLRLLSARAVREVTVRRMQALGRAVTDLTAPARVALALRGVGVRDVRRGDVLTTDPQHPHARRWWVTPPDPTDTGRADGWSQPGGSARPDPQGEVQVHVGSASTPGRLARRADGRLVLHLRDPVPAHAGDRAVLRSVGTGRVLGALGLTGVLDDTRHRRPPPSPGTAGPTSSGGVGRGTHAQHRLEPILARLRHDPLDAPPTEHLRALPGGRDLLARAERQGLLLRLSPDVVVGPDALAAGLRVLRRLPQPFSVGAAREALGTSRRVAVPLLERLARHGHTVRTGAEHRVREPDRAD